MTARKPRRLRARTRPVVEQAVETGLVLGWNRAHKWDEQPSAERIRELQHAAIMLELDEGLTMDEEGDYA